MHSIRFTGIIAIVCMLLMASCAFFEPQAPQGKAKPKKPPTKQAQKLSVAETDARIVQQEVASQQHQLIPIYKTKAAIKSQSGSVKITLYITEKGVVQSCTIEAQSGNLTQSFLDEIGKKVKRWRFSNREKVIYTFSTRFSKD